MTIEKYISNIIQREGGYVNNPADKGGPTKYGITQETLSDWRGNKVTQQDVEALKVEEAYAIYKEKYLIKPGIINISNYELQALILDTAVHSGAGRAIRFLQQALGINDDGIVGSVTIQCANAAAPIGDLRKKYLAARIRFVGRLITNDPSQATFSAGWSNRLADLLEELI